MTANVVEWIGREDAMQRLGKSGKTLDRYAAAGEIETKMEPVQGRKPRRVFYAPAVERLAIEIENGKTTRSAIAAGGTRDIVSLIVQVFERLAAAQEARTASLPPLPLPVPMPPPLPPTTPTTANAVPVQLWLSEAQARAYSGLSRSDLRALAASRTLVTRPYGRGLRYQRHALELFSQTKKRQ